MKNITFTILFTLLISTGTLQARLFFIGSNPHLSKIAFPQDILLINYGFIAYGFTYQPMPFWGDIDNPINKPNNSYTATEFDTSYSIPGTPDGISDFSFTGSANIFQHDLTYHKTWTERFNTMFTLTFKNTNMFTEASGFSPATLEDDSIEYVRFDNQLSRVAWMLYLESIHAYRAGSIPLAIKLGFGYESLEAPDSSFEATAHGISLVSDRILWGWSTSGCNHIFGYRHIGGDAWMKNDYQTGLVYQFDVQLGITLPRAKIGARYRLRKGEKHNYRWHSLYDFGDEPTSEEQFLQNFTGTYAKEKWSAKSYEHIGRIYSNITFVKTKMANLNTLLFFAVDHYESERVNAEDMDLSTNVKEGFTNYIIEVNPNANIFLGKGVIIDIGILAEFSWTDFENTYQRGSSLGGAKETYWNTSVNIGEEQSWENFSYADEHFFDFAWEINLQAPLFKSDNHLIAVNLVIMNNYKFTYNTKQYGENYDIGGSINFVTHNKRITNKREIWVNSSISLMYKYKRTFFRITYVAPLIYMRTTKMKVVGPLDNTLYRNTSSMQTSIMEGGSVSRHPAQFGSQMIKFMVGYQL